MAIPTLRSPTIPSGGLIPEKYTASRMGISPPLEWRRPPPGRPYLTIVVRSWLATGGDEIVHWLVYDVLEFVGGLPEDAGSGALWTTGQNSQGDASYLPFGGTVPRRAQFDMYATRIPTGLDGPAAWEDISDWLDNQNAPGPFGFMAYDVDFPALIAVSQ